MEMTDPYGSWKSPIQTDVMVGGMIGVGGLVAHGDHLLWTESRPGEGGRVVLVRRDPSGQTDDVTLPPFYMRTRVHEYGGGAYLLHDGTVYFSNFADQQLYRQRFLPDIMAPEAITAAETARRFADARIDDDRSRLICVMEDHSDTNREAVNTIVAVALDTGNVSQLVEGYDFYAAPRISPDGAHLLWVCWSHPNMPWDETELWCGDFASDGSVVNARCLAADGESVCTPDWMPSGEIVFVSDRSGWWNLYAIDVAGESPRALLVMDAEFAGAQWGLGGCNARFLNDHSLITTYQSAGRTHLIDLRVDTGEWREIETPFPSLSVSQCHDGKLMMGGASPDAFPRIGIFDLASGDFETVRTSSDLAFDAGYLSTPEAIEFPTTGDRTAHAFFYAPCNKDMIPDPNERPPLLAFLHGGPTGSTGPTLSLTIQYWTSRGFAVVDINYGGSTGFGREYRQRLNGQWGVVDVDDTEAAAQYLIDGDRVDGERLAIRGGSAGGYTTLAVLTFRDTFKAGASYYGVGDLEALAKDTHKFESRYLDSMIGRYPEDIDIYHERSPIHHVDQLSCPVIFFQGLEDKIVPPNQAEAMVEALDGKGLPVAYMPLEGEQHGFRQAKNIKRTLEAELYFYAQIFCFETADAIEPVDIRNLN
jgi:dipeptidyl aminopeptidase/acylaminoacyl peptidase